MQISVMRVSAAVCTICLTHRQQFQAAAVESMSVWRKQRGGLVSDGDGDGGQKDAWRRQIEVMCDTFERMNIRRANLPIIIIHYNVNVNVKGQSRRISCAPDGARYQTVLTIVAIGPPFTSSVPPTAPTPMNGTLVHFSNVRTRALASFGTR